MVSAGAVSSYKTGVGAEVPFVETNEFLCLFRINCDESFRLIRIGNCFPIGNNLPGQPAVQFNI